MAKERTNDQSQPVTSAPERKARWPRSFDDVGSLMDRMFEPEWMMRPLRWRRPPWTRLGAEGMRLPRVDVIERDDDVLVRAEIPGLKREELDVSLSENTLTIKGQSRSDGKAEEGDYYCCEMFHGAFARTLDLPCKVDADRVQATVADGILEIIVPKSKQGQRRKVEIE